VLLGIWYWLLVYWIGYNHRLYLSQQIPEFAIVYRDPAIQVKADTLVSVVAQFFIKSLEVALLFDELVPSPSIFFAVGCGGACKRK